MEISASIEFEMPQEQFARAVAEHSRAMFRAARAVLDSDADAEDAVSEAILRAWQAWGRLRKRESAWAWLLKITVNCAYEFLRKTNRTGDWLEAGMGVDGYTATSWDAETGSAMFAVNVNSTGSGESSSGLMNPCSLRFQVIYPTARVAFEGIPIPWDRVGEDVLESYTLEDGDINPSVADKTVLRAGQTPMALEERICFPSPPWDGTTRGPSISCWKWPMEWIAQRTASFIPETTEYGRARIITRTMIPAAAPDTKSL